MRALIPLPLRDYDPTDVAVSWSVLRAAGHEVVFATPDGSRAHPDEMMITGAGLPLFGGVLRANADARRAHAAMERDSNFLAPLAYAQVSLDCADGLVLPGGHKAEGMRPYLEDGTLHSLVAAFFDADKPVGAICHGTVVAARATSLRTGRSVLNGRVTTSLTWAQEREAWSIGRVVRFWDPHYYRTYREEPGEPAGYRGVEAEVVRALASPADYRAVPRDDPEYRRKTDGRFRDSLTDARPAFVVRDGNYVSARWPGDAHAFAKTFVQVLEAHGRSGSAEDPLPRAT